MATIMATYTSSSWHGGYHIQLGGLEDMSTLHEISTLHIDVVCPCGAATNRSEP